MTSSANTLQTGDYAQLPSETIATLRKGIRAATDAGISAAAVEQDVQRKYGVSVRQVMAANPSDFGRTVAQGLTLNHADELAGLYAKLTGKSYEKARDSIRKNDAAFQQVHPVLKLLTEAAAGSLTGMAAAPVAAIQKGATLANIGKSAALGAGLSGIAGEGASTAQTAGGVMGDAAKSAAIGGLLGAGTGALASKIANVGLPQGNKGAVATEAASQLPSDPTALRTALARQEQLAPGTVVLADASPQMQRFVKAIGADRTTAMEVAASEGKRVQALLTAKQGVGQAYDQLQGFKQPADQAIKDVLDGVGRRDLIKSGDVDLGKLHELRSALLKVSRSPGAGMKGTELGKAAGDITDWMQQAFPTIKQTDADYAFLTDRLKTAMQTQKLVLNSGSAYAANRAAGVTSGSLGGSIPLPNRGAVGTVISKVASMAKPDRVARAKAIASLLLAPQRDPQGLEGMILTHNALLQSQEQPALSLANAALLGGAIPQLSSPQ